MKSLSNQTLTKIQDIALTDLRYLIPCLVTWSYHRILKRDILRFPLQNGKSKKATLFQHGEIKGDKKEVIVTLFLHGLYSHPFVMRHLADIPSGHRFGPSFSFFIRYDLSDLKTHQALLKQAISVIERQLSQKNCSLKGLILVGHSMGAIEAAHTTFVEKDKRILATISIAGRLKPEESPFYNQKQSLKACLEEIYKGMQSSPHIPLYQLVGRHDWNASLDSTLVRKNPGDFHIIENGRHYDLLFHEETSPKLKEFLQKIALQAFSGVPDHRTPKISEEKPSSLAILDEGQCM